MSPEQQKQLKPGDEIFIRATYHRTDSAGDIEYSGEFRCIGIVDAFSYSVPENVFLRSDLQQPAEKPKYDPARKLKKGDKVKPCSWRNRIPSARLGATRIIPDTRVLEVMSDELHEHVALIYGDEVIEMHICFLELVTPVEELEPYSVCQDAEMECFEVYKCEYTEGEEGNEKVWKIVRTTYFYGDNQGLRTLAEAKAAAEAECARLNAEYRKEVIK